MKYTNEEFKEKFNRLLEGESGLAEEGLVEHLTRLTQMQGMIRKLILGKPSFIDQAERVLRGW